MATTITASVGTGGKNNSADVIAIQTLLNKWVTPPIAVTGTCAGDNAEDPTIKAIKSFQARFSKSPDGRVDAGGGTLKKLDMEPLFLLPQAGFGYYPYGKSDTTKRQWGTANTVKAVVDTAMWFNWAYPDALVGVGDISFEFGGYMDPHSTHQKGLHVDVRPCRKDNNKIGVLYTDTTNYDQEKTQFLIELFLEDDNVEQILFNDPVIRKAVKRVSWSKGHDDHFHVIMKS